MLHLDEIRETARRCADEDLLAAVEDVLSAVSVALAGADRSWVMRFRGKARKYADETLIHALRSLEPEHEARQRRWVKEGRQVTPRPALISRPTRTQEAEALHLTAVTREALAMASSSRTRSRTPRAFVGGFVHTALARCATTWRSVPDACGDRRARTVNPAARRLACEAITVLLRDQLRVDDWATDRGARSVVREYLRAIGLSAKAIGNVFR